MSRNRKSAKQRIKSQNQTIVSYYGPTTVHTCHVVDDELVVDEADGKPGPSFDELLAHPLRYHFEAVLPEFEPFAEKFATAQDEAMTAWKASCPVFRSEMEAVQDGKE